MKHRQEKFILYCGNQSNIHLSKINLFISDPSILMSDIIGFDILEIKVLHFQKIHIDENGSDMITKSLFSENYIPCGEIIGMGELLTWAWGGDLLGGLAHVLSGGIVGVYNTVLTLMLREVLEEKEKNRVVIHKGKKREVFLWEEESIGDWINYQYCWSLSFLLLVFTLVFFETHLGAYFFMLFDIL